MSVEQFAALQAVTPIVLDLNGDGINTVAASQGVMFDIDATGQQTQVGWVGAGSALLVRDLNGNGIIDDGTELFGGATQLADGTRAGDGFRAMAALDSNGDGILDANDEAWGELQLWLDLNGDGITDAGELHSLESFGISALNLGFTKGTDLDNGNLLGMVGSYQKADGSELAMVDVWFAKADAPAPTAADLLAAPGQALLDGGDSRATTAQAGSHGLLPQRSTLDDDLLRQNVPLI
jgi:hypothetical protein